MFFFILGSIFVKLKQEVILYFFFFWTWNFSGKIIPVCFLRTWVSAFNRFLSSSYFFYLVIIKHLLLTSFLQEQLDLGPSPFPIYIHPSSSPRSHPLLLGEFLAFFLLSFIIVCLSKYMLQLIQSLLVFMSKYDS